MNKTAEKLPEVINQKAIEVSQPSPMEIAQSFLKAGGDLENLEKMLLLQEKWEKREAEKAFYKAMAAFKKSPPKIFKDRHVDYTGKTGIRTQYDHASLGNIVELICTELSKHGLSADWDQKQENNQLTVTCYLTHELGFSKKTSMTAPPDLSGGKNGIQGLGSTNSYLQRYTLLALTGLATHEQDDDGRKSEPPNNKNFIARMKELSLNHKMEYQEIMDFWQSKGPEHITNTEMQEKIMAQIINKVAKNILHKTSEWKEWADVKERFSDVVGDWPDPKNTSECIEAVKQAKQAVDKTNA